MVTMPRKSGPDAGTPRQFFTTHHHSHVNNQYIDDEAHRAEDHGFEPEHENSAVPESGYDHIGAKGRGERRCKGCRVQVGVEPVPAPIGTAN